MNCNMPRSTSRHEGGIDYTNAEIRRAFMNRTYAGNAYSMNLVELPDGTFALLDYNWGKIAEHSPDGEITVFTGWSQWAKQRFREEYDGGGEPTTARHVRELTEYLIDEGRDFELSGSSPTVGSAPDDLRELGHLNMIPNRGTAAGRTE